MEPVSSSYNFTLVNRPHPVYIFESHFGASYEVKFKPGPELVDNPAFEDLIFELVIVLTDNPYAPRLPPVNALMSVTIARIIEDFFQIRERAIVYVCDDSDSKSDSRRKLLDRWYERFRDAKYFKTNVGLAVEQNGIQYSADFVGRTDNPLFGQIFESFRRKVSTEK